MDQAESTRNSTAPGPQDCPASFSAWCRTQWNHRNNHRLIEPAKAGTSLTGSGSSELHLTRPWMFPGMGLVPPLWAVSPQSCSLRFILWMYYTLWVTSLFTVLMSFNRGKLINILKLQHPNLLLEWQPGVFQSATVVQDYSSAAPLFCSTAYCRKGNHDQVGWITGTRPVGQGPGKWPVSGQWDQYDLQEMVLWFSIFTCLFHVIQSSLEILLKTTSTFTLCYKQLFFLFFSLWCHFSANKSEIQTCNNLKLTLLHI